MKHFIKFIYVVFLITIAVSLMSCEKEDVPNDCQCRAAVYENVINGKEQAYYDEPIQCIDGEPKPLELVKGNYVFKKCVNSPEY